MEFLIAVDMEGIHGVVGEPNVRYSLTEDYKRAIGYAAKEVNAVTETLFDLGATKVAVWDNHAGGGNLRFEEIDPRVTIIDNKAYPERMSFAKEHNFKGIIFLGYHSKAGTANGVLAHTYNGMEIQYAKINGKTRGEIEIDSWIAGTHGIAPILVASDDVCLAQIKELLPETVGVITKYSKARNEADYIDEDVFLNNLREGVKKAVQSQIKPVVCPMPAELIVRYSRMEMAYWLIEKAQGLGIPVKNEHEDGRVLTFTVEKATDIVTCL